MRGTMIKSSLAHLAFRGRDRAQAPRILYSKVTTSTHSANVLPHAPDACRTTFASASPHRPRADFSGLAAALGSANAGAAATALYLYGDEGRW